jgi:ElaA protein
MEFLVKQFDTLSAKELFEIYKLRSEVFIVEQNCAYQDVDEKDLFAYHVMAFEENMLAGYCRILAPGKSYKEPSIGRVVLHPNLRNKGLGKDLMKYSVNKSFELFKDQELVISAQLYLLKFYTELGFKAEDKEYLEDNIPHIQMRYTASLK